MHSHNGSRSTHCNNTREKNHSTQQMPVSPPGIILRLRASEAVSQQAQRQGCLGTSPNKYTRLGTQMHTVICINHDVAQASGVCRSRGGLRRVAGARG